MSNENNLANEEQKFKIMKDFFCNISFPKSKNKRYTKIMNLVGRIIDPILVDEVSYRKFYLGLVAFEQNKDFSCVNKNLLKIIGRSQENQQPGKLTNPEVSDESCDNLYLNSTTNSESVCLDNCDESNDVVDCNVDIGNNITLTDKLKMFLQDNQLKSILENNDQIYLNHPTLKHIKPVRNSQGNIYEQEIPNMIVPYSPNLQKNTRRVYKRDLENTSRLGIKKIKK